MLGVTPHGKRMVACLPLGCPMNPIEQQLCITPLGVLGDGVSLTVTSSSDVSVSCTHVSHLPAP